MNTFTPDALILLGFYLNQKENGVEFKAVLEYVNQQSLHPRIPSNIGYYHLNNLLAEGLVEQVGERPSDGCRGRRHRLLRITKSGRTQARKILSQCAQILGQFHTLSET